MKHVLLRWMVPVLAGVLVAGCYTVPETGRKSFNFMSEGEEMQLGFSEFDKMKKEVPISKDAAAKALVEKVGKRIAAVAPMPNAQWEFVVFDSAEVNAFCLPGGKVGVYAGILPITKDEAGLATVLGHEVAHAVARHGGERMSHAAATQLLGQGVAWGTSGSKYAALYTQAYGMGSQVLGTLPHSRANEAEADRMGLTYMARAGYNPEAAVAFWQRFADFNKKAGASNTPWFLRTHPLDEDRVKNLQGWMPEAKAAYQAPAK